MHLENLEILGFKSFAKKTNLIFPHGITCIVGPNGCGKSNIADCIRWILGELSLKNLRARKNSDLIFSAGKKSLNFSQSSLLLKDDKRGEIKIARRLFKNGENEYLINNKKVKREDLLLYLAQINFGQKSYSIIGQGMVDWILYSSKQERKDFFDEATGIREYQLKKAKAVAKIKRSLINLNQAEAAIKEVKPRMKFLSRQIKKWEKRQEIEKNLIELEKKYYGARLFKFKIEEERVKKKIKEREIILEKEENSLKIFQEQFGSLASYEPDQEFKKLQANWEKLLEKRNKFLEEKATSQAEIYKKRAEIKFERRDFKQLESPIKELVFKQEKLVEKLNQAQTTDDFKGLKKLAQETLNLAKGLLNFFLRPTSKQELEEEQQQQQDKQLTTLNEEIKSLEEKLGKFWQLENQRRKEMLEIQRKLQEKQNYVSSLNYGLKEIEIEKVKLETREEDLKKEIQREAFFKNLSSLPEIRLTEEEGEKIYSSIQNLKREMDLIGSFDESFLQEYRECKEKYDFLSTQINDLKKSITSLREVKKKLDEQIKKEFFSNFNKINKNFEEFFKFLFKGGSAKLVLEEETAKNNLAEILEIEKKGENNKEENEKEEMLEEENQEIKYGVEIYARPPQKKNKSVQALSGGEKALTSIALLCAILKTKNPPFVVLDEVDAALDEANSIRLTEIIKELAKNTQCIIVTHNPVTMEIASALYGVTLDKESSSHLISMKLEGI